MGSGPEGWRELHFRDYRAPSSEIAVPGVIQVGRRVIEIAAWRALRAGHWGLSNEIGA
jgi:hypothetical protein